MPVWVKLRNPPLFVRPAYGGVPQGQGIRSPSPFLCSRRTRGEAVPRTSRPQAARLPGSVASGTSGTLCSGAEPSSGPFSLQGEKVGGGMGVRKAGQGFWRPWQVTEGKAGASKRHVWFKGNPHPQCQSRETPLARHGGSPSHSQLDVARREAGPPEEAEVLAAADELVAVGERKSPEAELRTRHEGFLHALLAPAQTRAASASRLSLGHASTWARSMS